MSMHGVTGEAWNCPHCGERILRSSVTCPACHRHLRFEALTTTQSAGKTVCPFLVDGTIRHSGTDAACEYSVLIEVRDDRGEILARRVVSVGALKRDETRTVTLRVETQASGEPIPPARS